MREGGGVRGVVTVCACPQRTDNARREEGVVGRQGGAALTLLVLAWAGLTPRQSRLMRLHRYGLLSFVCPRCGGGFQNVVAVVVVVVVVLVCVF